MSTRTITYKGFTIELGELPEPRKAYWQIINEDGDRFFSNVPGQRIEVECGSWEDLERIAKRSIDAAIEGQ